MRWKSTRKTFGPIVSLILGMAGTNGIAADFSYDSEALTGAKPWTSEDFNNSPENFQFLVVGDRTGGANVEGTFDLAADQIRLLQPEFVINVGDLIEGYSDDPAELNAEWDEADARLEKMGVPFFRTPGNHDIANSVAQEVWRERFGASGLARPITASFTAIPCFSCWIVKIRHAKPQKA